jgi:enterobacteria phage integrase
VRKRKLKKQLKKALKKLAASRQLAPVALTASAADGPTLSEWLVTYRKIIEERGYAGQTLKNRRSMLKHIESMWGATQLRSIKPHEIASKLKLCRPHTAGRVLGELRDIYSEAMANGAADSSPASHVKSRPAPSQRKRLTLDTWQSMLRLAQAGPQRWVPAMLLLAMATGQRRADLAKMRFDDIVDGYLRVEQQKKARKKIGARLAIPLLLGLDATGMTLGDIIEHCKTIGKPGEHLLRQANGRPIELSSLTARFHECIVAVRGEDAYQQFEWPSLHEVRSLSARTYIAEGMTPETVQTLMGHKHADMTDLYLNDRGLTAAEWKTVDLPT